MNCAREARKLAEYIIGLGPAFTAYEPANEFSYKHIGALFTDVILQAGLNYNTVVKPRVQRVLLEYPDANTVQSFKRLIELEGLHKIILWNHTTKLDRMHRLLEFAVDNGIDSCVDLKIFLLNPQNHFSLLSLNGVGPKTVDYLMKLLNFDTVAVDRHIYTFVELADIRAEGYLVNKKIVEYAADFLQLPRNAVDYSIWKYMSEKRDEAVTNPQLALQLG